MKKKLVELKDLMAQGGLSESLNVVDEMLTRSDNRKKQLNQTGRNISHNCSVCRNDDEMGKMVKHSESTTKSLETIYETAVKQKRGSSSSEDNLINTSDETELDRDPEIVNAMDILIAGGKQLSIQDKTKLKTKDQVGAGNIQGRFPTR